MSDAAVTEIQPERKQLGKGFWGKGIVLARIWREVLGFFSGQDRDRLNEFKREMWLLLVAAGSGYLARCWHRTLTAKPQLTDYAHDDREVDVTNEEATTSKSAEQAVLEEPSPNVSLKKFTATLDTELAPRPSKRSFSPKAISKKLFHSDSTKRGKAGGRKDGQTKSSAADERSGDGSNSASTSGEPVVAHRKKGPWSTFKSKKSVPSKEHALGEENIGNSPSFLRETANLSHKSNRVQGRENGSSSSRSLQSYFEEGDLDADSVASSSPGQSGQSQSGALGSAITTPEVATINDEVPGSVRPGEVSEEVSSEQSRGSLVANELRSFTKEQQSPETASNGSKSKDGNGPANVISNDSNELASRRDGATSVAEVVAQIEKGNLATTEGETSSGGGAGAAHRRRAAFKANVEGAVREKVRSLKDLVEEVEVHPGGKGKRRAADAAPAKGMADGEKATVSGAFLTGKRPKDSEKDAIKLGPRETVGFTLASITGKRMKDVDIAKNDRLGGEAPSSEKPSLSSTVGSVDLSQVFFGFDEAFWGSVSEEKSPSKYYRRRHGKANTRRMRESPKPVSALESCLRAQFPEEEESRVVRSLNFSSSLSGAKGVVSRPDNLEVGSDAPVSRSDSLSPGVLIEDSRASDGTEQKAPHTESPLGLPVLKVSPSKGSAQRADHRLIEKKAQETLNSVPNYPRNVVLEDRGSVVSSQSRLNDVLWRRTTLPSTLKKRKVSQACSGSASSPSSLKVKGYELEALVIPPMEGLLFSFGVGIGVMSLTGETDGEIERLSTELRKSKEEIENLNNLLKEARESPEQASAPVSTQVMVVGSLAIEKVTGEVSGSSDPLHNRLGISSASGDETGIELFDLVRKEAPETPQQTEHMAELEAELEAELDALTCGVLDGGDRSALIFDELDPEGVAGVADRDLGVEGLPALLDWDDDNDDFITEEYISTGGGVPPRELRRLLRKVQSSRQELLIAELEVDLHESVNKLQAMEKELQRLRESSTPAAGAAASSSTGVEAELPESSVAATSSERSGRFDDISSPKARDRIVSSAVAPSDEEASPQPDIHRNRDKIRAICNQLVEETGKSRNEPTEGPSPSHEPRLGLSEALVRKLISSPLSSQATEPESSHRRSRSVSVSALGEAGSGIRRSLSNGPEFDFPGQASLPTTSVVSEPNNLRPGEANARPLLQDKSADSGGQADNDAVFDEFLSSVFGSDDEGGQSIGSSSVVSNPRVTNLPKVFSLDEADFPVDDDDDVKPTGDIIDLQDVHNYVGGRPVEEDLDQVVGELLKRDTSSVKNALNAFLLWEAAETENVENKDDVIEKEAGKESSPRYSRRTAGKNATPQKTLSAADSSLKTSVLASRLEQLARASFTTEKMPHLDSRSPRRRGTSNQTTRKLGVEDDLDVFQPPVPQPEERSVRTIGRRDRQPSLGASLTIKRDQGAPLSRRQSLSAEGRKEALKSETPVFGSSSKDFEALLEARREMRYSSSRVDLSAARPATQEPDVRSRYRQREDASRAGTNSPTGRNPTSVAPFYPSPKPKGSRLGFENKLYKNPTSDWIAEVANPPDK